VDRATEPSKCLSAARSDLCAERSYVMYCNSVREQENVRISDQVLTTVCLEASTVHTVAIGVSGRFGLAVRAFKRSPD